MSLGLLARRSGNVGVLAGGWVKALCPSHLEPNSFWSQVLLVQYKRTGEYYAVKALKKQEVLGRDEVDRCA